MFNIIYLWLHTGVFKVFVFEILRNFRERFLMMEVFIFDRVWVRIGGRWNWVFFEVGLLFFGVVLNRRVVF